MLKKAKLASTLLLMSISTNLWAETGYIEAHVTRTSVSDRGIWGGCMALLDKEIATESSAQLNCPGRWISFSCDGTYNGKDIAYRKLDIAQRAEITGKNIVASIDDTKKHNGYCYAWRVQSTPL